LYTVLQELGLYCTQYTVCSSLLLGAHCPAIPAHYRSTSVQWLSVAVKQA